MAKEYKVGDRYYLPVTVKSICPGYTYPIELRFIDSNLGDTDDTTSIADEPDLLLTAEDIATVINTESGEALEELKAKVAKLEAENASLKESLHEASEENSANDEALAQMSVKKAELEAKLAELKDTICKQSDKLRELQARIVELNEVNSSLGENRDALNDEAAVHMTSIHHLQVAVEVLAEKIFEMRCEQDG